MPAAPFTVIIPARLASTRLPRKPLADIAGKPMVVRVAERAMLSGAAQALVAADSEEIIAACGAHGVPAVLTRADHASGSDRLAEAVDLLNLPDDAIVVNLQGDEPLMDPTLVGAVARLLAQRPDASIATSAHPIANLADFASPNVVKVVTDAHGCALLFSRAPLPWWRDGFASGITELPHAPAALRHIGLYAYRAAFLREFPRLPAPPLETCEGLEQLRALWHGYRIAVHVSEQAPAPGVDTAADLERVRALWPRTANAATGS